MAYVWTLVWLMALIGAFVSAITTIFLFAGAAEEEDVTRLWKAVGMLFVTAFLGWASWAASFMS